MFHEALNAPVMMLLIYLLGLLPLLYCMWLVWQQRRFTSLLPHEVAGLIVSALLWGAGAALLGAAYLHDVWYC